MFGYTVEVNKPSHAPNEPWTTELERFVGPVIDWRALQDKANNRARFYAEAFGVTLFIADRDQRRREDPPMIVTLHYSVPVEVEFDTDTGRVRQVLVDDENTTFTGRAEDTDGKPIKGDTQALADAADDTGYGWPEWQVGR